MVPAWTDVKMTKTAIQVITAIWLKVSVHQPLATTHTWIVVLKSTAISSQETVEKHRGIFAVNAKWIRIVEVEATYVLIGGLKETFVVLLVKPIAIVPVALDATIGKQMMVELHANV